MHVSDEEKTYVVLVWVANRWYNMYTPRVRTLHIIIPGGIAPGYRGANVIRRRLSRERRHDAFERTCQSTDESWQRVSNGMPFVISGAVVLEIIVFKYILTFCVIRSAFTVFLFGFYSRGHVEFEFTHVTMPPNASHQEWFKIRSKRRTPSPPIIEKKIL